MFETPQIKVAFPLMVLKRAGVVVLAAYLGIGLIAGYRAYHQVHSVNLNAGPRLQLGSSIETSVVTYGRTFVDVRIELIQGAHADVLAVHRIPNNEWAFMDPRPKHVSHSTLLNEDTLKKFQPGSATLRATVTGLPQLGHVPPPMVRETVVEIR